MALAVHVVDKKCMDLMLAWMNIIFRNILIPFS